MEKEQMQQQPVPYEKQIFVCTNDRKGESPSCGDHQGEAVFKELRRIAKERGLSAGGARLPAVGQGSALGGHPRIRVAQAKCLGQCSTGVNIMVYPDNVWYKGVTPENCGLIAEKYLVADFHP